MVPPPPPPPPPRSHPSYANLVTATSKSSGPLYPCNTVNAIPPPYRYSPHYVGPPPIHYHFIGSYGYSTNGIRHPTHQIPYSYPLVHLPCRYSVPPSPVYSAIQLQTPSSKTVRLSVTPDNQTSSENAQTAYAANILGALKSTKHISIVSPPAKTSIEWSPILSSTDSPDSARRCVKLINPVPSIPSSSTDGDNEKVPEFVRLVNFPDYVSRKRPRSEQSTDAESSSLDGKRNCVMCGTLRICTADGGSINLTNLATNTKKSTKDNNTESDSSKEPESTHIIPRQNKGVCTACDVAVWLVVDSKLKIKWCKGCKNFRPWVSFGEKGMATKCVRCRNRQKEKYATQKKENSVRKELGQTSFQLDESRVNKSAGYTRCEIVPQNCKS